MSTETTRHEQVVSDYAAWVNGDSSKRDVLSESIDVYNPGMPDGEVHTRRPFEAELQKVKTGFPDFQFTHEEVLARDDVAMVEFTITGTHTGEFKGIPPTGRPVTIRGVDKFRIADGEIQELHVYYDTGEIPKQLGLTFPTVLGQLPKLVWRKIQ